MAAPLGILITEVAEREFFVWVEPNNFLVRHNMMLGFFGGPLRPGDDDPNFLMFVENPNKRGVGISPFHLGVTQNYRVEYNLDRFRFHAFRDLPSRLHALFLFESREEALRYREIHPEHVQVRVLKRAVSEGAYKFSVHDGAWVDFLRIPQGMDDAAIHECNKAYWRGELAEQYGNAFRSVGQPWKPASFREVLYYGRIQFPNRDPSAPD